MKVITHCQTTSPSLNLPRNNSHRGVSKPLPLGASLQPVAPSITLIRLITPRADERVSVRRSMGNIKETAPCTNRARSDKAEAQQLYIFHEIIQHCSPLLLPVDGEPAEANEPRCEDPAADVM
uniref:Uncharacterized protein n=1 Tax=Knipowitschia caucasica TaxID=637954 RepID=A0AAV2M7C6_KNICA